MYWTLLTHCRNDLVKAVAAVNKNVIVVGEFLSEHFAVALLDALLTCWRSSQRRTNHPRIDSVERQRASHCMGWVSIAAEFTPRTLLTNLACPVKNWATALSTSCTALPPQAANFLTPLLSKHPTTALRSSMVTTTTPRDFTSTTDTSTRRALLLATNLASVSVCSLHPATIHDILTSSKHTPLLTTPA